MSSKKSVARKTSILKEKNKQTVLRRDGTSQLLILGDVNKVSPVDTGSKLVPGVTVSWQDNTRQRWRGLILASG